ncbi:MAG: hypothetical protein JWM49_610 [Microbacteriaceae bacterium]|nr:hypothetical protein [Microbacteriaceae bacterium]
MTAWQDQPPVSRRQVRQTERDESIDADVSRDHENSNNGSFAGLARQGWEADARRASAPEGPPTNDVGAPVVRGRRAQQAASGSREDAPAVVSAEPVAYVAPVRPEVPGYDVPSLVGRPISAVSDSRDRSAEAAPEPQRYRARDYSPEGRRSAFRPVGPAETWEPPVSLVPTESPDDAAAQEPTESDAAPASSSSASASSSSEGATETDRPLTRRELRARGLGGFATAPAGDAPDKTEPAVEKPAVEAVAEAAPVEAAPAEEVLEEPAVDSAPVAEPAPERPRFRERIRDSLLGSSRSSQAEEPETPADDVTLAEILDAPEAEPLPELEVIEATVVDSPETAVVVAELDSTEEARDSAPAFEDLLFPNGAPAEVRGEETADIRDAEVVNAEVVEVSFDEFVADLQAAADEPEPVTPQTDGSGFTPPVGHWSTQALIDDDEQVSDGTVGGRDVAATSGALTTNALVLPSIPSADGIMGPLSGTGEILITGSINLSSSIGNTGVHPTNYDHSDVDALLEATDREDAEPGSAPVRAIRAVSTHTGSADVIGSMKPPKISKVPMVLTITASSMGVGVVGLLVAGLIFKIF